MLAPLLAHWRERPQRTWSVLVTVFGDAITPRGGSVWLRALIELAGALGIDAGAVRTAMSRLVADGWTERTRVGRGSTYQLTPQGRTTFAAAASRIYAAHSPAWDGHFRLVLQPEDRAPLESAGFSQALPGLWVATGAGHDVGGLTLTAQCDLPTARDLAARAWPLHRLATSFTRFNHAFAALPAGPDPTPLEAMAARTLLIHEYRRIVLFTPDLPAELLPPDWPGEAARRLCANAYQRLLPASERWLDEHDLPPPGPDLGRRFAA